VGTIEPARGARASAKQSRRDTLPAPGRFEGLTALVAGLASAIVPRDLRAHIVERTAVSPPFWSASIGIVEVIGGPLLLVDGFLRTVPRYVDEQTNAALAAGFEYNKVDALPVMWGGAFAWLRWLTSPVTLLLLLATVTGAVRLMSFGLNGEAIGEPLVWVGWRAWRRFVVKPIEATQRAARYGPQRPDRVMPQPDGTLLVLSVTPHQEWNELTTIEVGDRFYRLVDSGELDDGGWTWHTHRLREEDPTAVIRSLVRYVPPDEPPAATADVTRSTASPPSAP
jgi:hypothetical protein